jgi:hypothetical protein
MKKAVFLDIDGTILDCFNGIMEIRPAVKAAIRKLQAEGNLVFIATGRPYPFLDKEILEFGFDGYVLANGAHLILNGETVYSSPLDNKFVVELSEELDRKGIQYFFNGKTHSYMKNGSEEFYNFLEHIKISRDAFEHDFDINKIETFKVEVLCPDQKTKEFVLEFMKNYPEYASVCSISENHLELYLKRNSKASGILKLLEYIDVPLEETYAFGDGRNDIEMLSTVGCGIAMGNASDEVKKYAKEVTDTVHEDGVATGIKKYILKGVQQ